VVKAGTIVEQGTHEELQAAGGAYAALIAMQQSGSAPPAAAVAAEGASELPISHSPGSRASSSSGGLRRTSSGSSKTASVPGSPTRGGRAAAPAAWAEGRPAAAVVALTPLGAEQGVQGWRRYFSMRRRARTAEAPAPAAPRAPQGDAASEDSVAAAAQAVPLSRLADLNRNELPAAMGGMLGSIGMGMLMPAFSIAFSSLIGVFYLSGTPPPPPLPPSQLAAQPTGCLGHA
jgi:hypothetical protein